MARAQAGRADYLALSAGQATAVQHDPYEHDKESHRSDSCVGGVTVPSSHEGGSR